MKTPHRGGAWKLWSSEAILLLELLELLLFSCSGRSGPSLMLLLLLVLLLILLLLLMVLLLLMLLLLVHPGTIMVAEGHSPAILLAILLLVPDRRTWLESRKRTIDDW